MGLRAYPVRRLHARVRPGPGWGGDPKRVPATQGQELITKFGCHGPQLLRVWWAVRRKELSTTAIKFIESARQRQHQVPARRRPLRCGRYVRPHAAPTPQCPVGRHPARCGQETQLPLQHDKDLIIAAMDVRQRACARRRGQWPGRGRVRCGAPPTNVPQRPGPAVAERRLAPNPARRLHA